MREATCLLAIAFLLVSEARQVDAHAFLDHAEPKVGSTVSAPPAVKIWFDAPIEPVFPSLEVFQKERKVNRAPARVEEGENLLIVDLPPLPGGRYQVKWKVLARDGHVTEGEFDFRVR